MESEENLQPRAEEHRQVTAGSDLTIVGIGASAGGLEAVSALLSALRQDTGFAFIVLIHSDPRYESKLQEILTGITSLSVQAATPLAKPQPNHIYVAPNDAELYLDSEGAFRFRKIATQERKKGRINHLLSSLAETSKGRAIGILLSGTGNDGTEGIAKIKDAGGITFAQSDQTAQFGAMPKNAIATGQIDFVLPPQEIAFELSRLSQSLQIDKLDHSSQVDPNDAEQTRAILDLVHKTTGTDFNHYKQSTIQRRLRRRIGLNNSGTLGEYLVQLRHNPVEIEVLFRDFLINVTNFFRDPEIFETLKTSYIPQLVQDKSPNKPIRVWVPGCSSGEELYSIAILLWEYLGEKAATIPIQLFGTDLSEQAIEQARSGIYSESIVNDISSERLERFFVKIDSGYQICKTIREACVFARHNIIVDPPLAKMDLISCRNLLIYFAPAVQQKVIPLLHYAIRPSGGVLLLGKSEVIDVFEELFVCTDKAHKIYVKKRQSSKVRFDFTEARTATRPHSRDQTAMNEIKNTTSDVKREVDRLIINNFSPSGVVVNDRLEVLHFRGDTSLYFNPSSGRASLNLIKIIHNDLLTEIKSALGEVQAGVGIQAQRRGIPLRREDSIIHVDIKVTPLKQTDPRESYYFIVFEKRPVHTTTPAQEKESESQEVKRLYDELQATRKFLHNVIDERETSTEELQSANEEIISANEELQTINQELETSKEELESSNEELTTVNEEMRIRVEELRQSEERFRILVSGVKDYAIFILDQTGVIQSWNAGAQRIKGYTAEEIVGKHFSVFYPTADLESNKPERELQIALKEGQYVEEGQRLKKDGSLFWAHVTLTPLYDTAKRHYGFAKVTRDITKQRAAEASLRLSEERFRILVSGVKDYAIFMLDPKGYVTTWNAGAEQIKGYTAEEIIGQHFSRFYHNEAIARQHPQKELEIAAKTGRYEEEGFRIRKDGSTFLANVVITALYDEHKELKGFTKVTRDITERDKFQRLETEKQAAVLANQTKSLFLANMSHEIRTPLTAIVGFSEILSTDSSLNPDTLAYLESIKRNAKHLSSLVGEVLDLSKVEANQLAVEKSPVSLAKEIDTTISLLALKAKEKCLEMKVDYTTPVPETIFTDQTRLRQILVNILGNAIKFTDAGPIKLGVKMENSAAKECIVFTVTDFGNGIAQDKQDQIFKPFEQAIASQNHLYGGTGLGLSLSRQLARLLGGDVILKRSEVGHGSTFEISIDPGPLDGIPLQTPGKVSAMPVDAPIQNVRQLEGIQVLLVEDTVDNQILFNRILSKAGAKVRIANNGEEGVQVALAERFDVILMDMKMPVLGGCEATTMLRERKVTTPIIAFTAHATKEERDRSLDAGCNDYRSKPISAEDLRQVITKWSEKGSRD